MADSSQVKCKGDWGEAPFHLLQPVLLGVLTGLVWMVLGIFACRANVWACFLAAMGVGVWWRSRSTLAACKVGQQGEMDCIKETKKS